MGNVPPQNGNPIVLPSVSSLKKKRVLLIEDSRDIAESIMAFLQKDCFIDVENDSVKAFSSYRPGFYDLIFVDEFMPKMDGYELFRNIRRIDARAKVCMMSANNGIGSRMRESHAARQIIYAMEREEALPRLNKPFDKATLLAMVSRLTEE
jgi:CheY-like chemotaxis protein